MIQREIQTYAMCLWGKKKKKEENLNPIYLKQHQP